MMASSLQGKTIVVAGGTGGMGQVCANELTAEGARVVISHHRSLQEKTSVPSVPMIQADLRIAADRRRLLDLAGALYGLVVFAGIPARVNDPGELEEKLRESFETNLLGPVMLAREAATKMKAGGTQGAIVLLSTMQASSLFAGSTAYASPKAALVHAARILAKENRGAANIRVNVVAPGVIDAGMAKASIQSGKYNRFVEDGSIARFGRPEDVAHAVRFLLEPDCYVTGQVIGVDGGLSL